MDCGCSFKDISIIQNACGANLTIFMTLVDLLIRNNCQITDPCRRVTQNSSRLRSDEYDFIIVGGGVAGAVVAGRLSENPEWNVLLLEAGPEEPSESSVPTYFMSAPGTEVDWGFKTQPQSGACLSTGGVCNWPRGKMLGGSGSMSGSMYIRGNKEIFNEFARNGNEGWSYDEVLPYFKKAENNKNPDIIEKKYHGMNGPLTVQTFPYQPDFLSVIIKAGEEMGYRLGDLNGENQTGITIAQMMLDDGLRASTPRMYLRPEYNRKNLQVSINSQVTRIVIDKKLKRATGVEFLDNNGIKRQVRAKKEVILSAGSIGSPHLLLLSGVGPAKDLERHNIPVIQDLKVGQNLRNHVSVNVKFFITKENKRSLTMKALREYLDNRTGPMSSDGLTQLTVFMTSKYAKNGIPDIQINIDGYFATCSFTGSEKECNDGSFNSNCGERVINSRPANVMPLSKGYLTLKSNDPLEYPLIYPNYLSEQRDVDVLIDGIKQTIRLTNTEAMKKWNTRLNPVPEPNCAGFKFATDRYWECVIKNYTAPENHQIGTCKMGPSMEDAVVDPMLRVHGIPNLRVIDASIFPGVINSNIIAAIVMAAEKGSDMIKNEWKS